MCSSFFFFNDTATTEIYTLSLHDALPICRLDLGLKFGFARRVNLKRERSLGAHPSSLPRHRPTHRWQAYTRAMTEQRSEERFSRNAETDLVCRLLLEKKKNCT